jgi:predicted Na+-dependent transporter
MSTIPATLRQQQSTVLSLVTLLIVACVSLQLWLLAATLETAFHPEPASALPAVVISTACTLVSWWLCRLLRRRN